MAPAQERRNIAPCVATRGQTAALGIEAVGGTAVEPQEDVITATISRRLVSLADAADALAVSTRTVRRYIAEGHLDAVRLGHKTLRIKIDSIERFIDARPAGNWR